jgi:hypothetical protein
MAIEHTAEEMRAHHEAVTAQADRVPGLSADERRALRWAIYDDAVIDVYSHAGGDWVIELNHFPGTRGWCAQPWSQFLLTPERWHAVYLDVLSGTPLERLPQ